MPGMRITQKQVIEAADTIDGWFSGCTDDELVREIHDYTRCDSDFEKELADHLAVLRLDNCGCDTYDLAQRLEDALYRIHYGIFWKLIRKGKYVKDRVLYHDLLKIGAG